MIRETRDYGRLKWKDVRERRQRKGRERHIRGEKGVERNGKEKQRAGKEKGDRDETGKKGKR